MVERMKERLSMARAWRAAPGSRGLGRGTVMDLMLTQPRAFIKFFTV
jgi:hypothetical protein